MMEKRKVEKENTTSKMVSVVLKSNRMQTAALSVTYVLTFALMVMLVFFYPSIEKTFDQYLSRRGLPEGTVLTSVIPKDMASEALKDEGIRASVLRFLLETQVSFPGGKNISCRCISVTENDTQRYYDTARKEDVVPNGDSVMISSYFASQNNVREGDSLSIQTSQGWKEVRVTDVVSAPETISTNRNQFSWYDSNDFAYLFLGEELMETLFPCAGFCNRIDIWFYKDADADGILTDVEEKLGSTVISAGTYEGSETQKQIKGSLDGTRAIVTYLPAFLIGMGTLFSTLFFVQIVNRGEKRIGLMMALGFDDGRISIIYVLCALRLTLLSAVLGFVIGVGLLRFMLQIYVGTYDLPFIVYDGSLWALPLLLLAIVLVGVVSSLLSCLRFGKFDPVRIFQNESLEQERDLPKWIQQLRMNAFVKMSLCNIYRNQRKFWLSVLCGMACLILTFLSFSIITAKNESIRYLFKERFRYDYAVRCESMEALKEIAALPGIEASEQVFELDFSYEGEALLIQALPANCELIGIHSVTGEVLTAPSDGILLEEGFARRHHLAAGDTIRVNDNALTVQAITREYYDSVQYVSEDTAALLGGKNPNTIMIRLKEDCDVNAFLAAVSEVNGYLYYYGMDSRQACIKAILSALDLPCYVFALFSIVIGAVIVSTMNLIAIAQRRKKFATLYALGTDLPDFLRMELPEVVLQFIATVALAFLPAVLCSKVLLRQMSGPSQEFVLVNPFQTLCISSVVVAAYLLIGVIVTCGAIQKMNYLEVLSEK